MKSFSLSSLLYIVDDNEAKPKHQGGYDHDLRSWKMSSGGMGDQEVSGKHDHHENNPNDHLCFPDSHQVEHFVVSHYFSLLYFK